MKKLSIVIAVSALILGFVGCGAAASNAETAKAGLKAKEMDAEEAKLKAAADEANELASYLMEIFCVW